MTRTGRFLCTTIALAAGILSVQTVAAQPPQIGQAEVKIGGQPAVPSSPSAFGFLLLHRGEQAQVALMGRLPGMSVSLRKGQEVEVVIPIEGIQGPFRVTARAVAEGSGSIKVSLALGDKPAWRVVRQGTSIELEAAGTSAAGPVKLRLRMRLGGMPSGSVGMGRSMHGDEDDAMPPDAMPPEAAVEWRDVRIRVGNRAWDLPIRAAAGNPEQFPPPALPPLHKAIEDALIDWDWRMQDGIGTDRAPSTYAAAIRRTLDRGDRLIVDLQANGLPLSERAAGWDKLKGRFQEVLTADMPADAPAWEDLWRDVHRLRREIAMANPLAQVGPLVFVKQAPSNFSHQLTQYQGNCARPGGGVFVLESPGRSMQCRELGAGALPLGSYEFPEVSYDGRKVLFAYCGVEKAPPDRERNVDHFFHLYEVDASRGLGIRDWGLEGANEKGTSSSPNPIPNPQSPIPGPRAVPGLRQLTDGPFDDFAPRCLPDGKIVFISSRRGGFHRCGRGPCPVHTLALANADGSDPHPISFHETHEWDPAVLDDGRVIYTRWDYVDRNAIFYEQLWTTRPDGTDVRIYYGNNTLSPVGIWEARAVPGSHRVMATAAAHHAMTAGSIILLDTTRGVDGPGPITRLTPDALFPESEVPVISRGSATWYNPVGVAVRPKATPETQRWPGHTYRTPYPLSENYFLAAYSFDRLIGEPDPNPVNMFGLYLVDAFGNKELLYRDLNICSLWPVPLRARPVPPQLPALTATADPRGEAGVQGSGFRIQRAEVVVPNDAAGGSPEPRTLNPKPSPATRGEGTFFVANVYQSWPPIPAGSVRRVRIVQVLPKSTWHANDPPLGLPNISPGKQVLGTVPVEADGSAYFRAPAGIPLSFQALDELGQAVQVMRSVAYLQPGENASCVGCHEHRTTAPGATGVSPLLPITTGKMAVPPVAALRRDPSLIQPGPDGSKPLSYPILVQPVLDKHCVSCHRPEKPDGKIILTGQPQGHYTISYNALARRVSYSDWAGKPGDFRTVNSEPLSVPGFFGARGSSLTKLLRDGHYKVTLSPDDWDRLTTWMDANALFYGTFDKADQARQLRGERIAGPRLE